MVAKSEMPIGMDAGLYAQSTLANLSLDEPNDGPPGPVRVGGVTAAPQPIEEATVTAIPPLFIRALSFPTMFSELSGARIPADFALVRQRLQQEWTFDGGFVCQFTIMFLDSQLIGYKLLGISA